MSSNVSNPTDMLLDFSTPFDDAKINLFDQVVQAMYSNNPQDVSKLSLKAHNIS